MHRKLLKRLAPLKRNLLLWSGTTAKVFPVRSSERCNRCITVPAFAYTLENAFLGPVITMHRKWSWIFSGDRRIMEMLRLWDIYQGKPQAEWDQPRKQVTCATCSRAQNQGYPMLWSPQDPIPMQTVCLSCPVWSYFFLREVYSVPLYIRST